MRDLLASSINSLAGDIYENNKAKGFWERDRDFLECLALMHSELSEACEAHRNGNPPDDKIPSYSGEEAELADCIIRILDYCGHKNYDIGGAIITKIEFNKRRPHKHGKIK